MITKKSVALEKFEEEFCTALKVKGKKIGSYSTDYWGMHDGNEGVQWNIWENKKSEIWLGVNLEGKEYNNWPIADFIINELREGKLISLARGIDYSSMIWVGMHRDAWGKNGIRELIEERKIGQLKVGSIADISVFELRSGKFEFYDSYDNKLIGDKKLVPIMTFKNGKLIYSCND